MNRKQVCTVNGKLSEEKQINCGVPQGSNLGPFLFLLYINDVPNCFETTNARLFADDATLLATGLNTVEVEAKLNHDFLNVDQWLKAKN